MFSSLGPLFKPLLRQAETSDTRLAIPHEERQDGRRKPPHEQEKATGLDLWEDSTSVSVAALKAFLINFLKTLPQEKAGSGSAPPAAETFTPSAPAQPPQQGVAAQAARAYQSMADKTHTPEAPPPDPAAAPAAPLVSAGEIRTIHRLIGDLETLSERGIETLNIERAATFLDSLVVAVDSEKSKL